MKTAISLPNALFEAAEQYAQARGLSRSELYALALQLYLQMHQAEAITKALNETYAVDPAPLESGFLNAQIQSLPKEEW